MHLSFITPDSLEIPEAFAFPRGIQYLNQMVVFELQLNNNNVRNF